MQARARPRRRPAGLACVVALLLAGALLAPLTATAGAVANGKLASGVSACLAEVNVKQPLTLSAEKRWGTEYMHARYYSPNLGRFLSVDPVGGSVGSSQSWNRYSYVQNNPLNLVDPDGEAAKEVADALDDRVGEASEFYLDLAETGVSDNDGTLLGIALDAALGSVADVGQGLADAGSMLGDSLRAGDALGEAIGSGAGAGQTALATGKDTFRLGLLVTFAGGIARSTVGEAAIGAAERGAAAATSRALQTQIGRRLIGKGGLLNSGRNLRIGFGRRGGEGVIRVGGQWFKRLTGRSHWDLINLGKL